MKQPDKNSPESPIGTIDALLALSWIVLFGGRWIAGNFLVGFGVVSLGQLEEWDTAILERCYLVLFTFTIISVCLRSLRQERETP